MPDPMDPYWLGLAFAVLVQFFVFLRWLHRRLRYEEMQRDFVRDMATNHLPHIYHALRLIATHLNIQLDEPPPLRFMDVSDHDNRRR